MLDILNTSLNTEMFTLLRVPIPEELKIFLTDFKTSGSIYWKVSAPIKHLLKSVLHLRGCASNSVVLFFILHSGGAGNIQYFELSTNNLLFISETLD